jgi:transforming growth factor-beta-induced protein
MKTLKIIKSTKMIMAVALVALFGLSNSFAENPKAKTKSMTVVEIASSNDQFSTLVDAVVKAGLVDALNASGPYTVFAPTNQAFDNLFAALGVNGIDDLTADQLTPILLYHVVSGEVLAADVKTGMVPTLNKNAELDVKVTKKGVKIDKNATVIATDIEASNGVIHVIDAVLIPGSEDKASASNSSCGS